MIKLMQPGYGSSQTTSTLVAAMVTIQLVQMIPYGAGIVSANTIAEDLARNSLRASWIAASYPLTQGTFVILGGRIGALLGHKKVLFYAATWWSLCSLVTGFMPNLIALCIMRAGAGIGGAFMVPNAVALLTINIPPGRARNIALGLFGATAPIGAAGGSIFGGIFAQLTHWRWLFWFLAMLGALVFTLAFLVVPSDNENHKGTGSFDYFGAYLGVCGLILFNFVWNQAPFVGWQRPYEISLLVVGVLHLAAFVEWERSWATSPLLPFDIWTAPSLPALLLASFASFMAFGILIWYFNQWLLNIRGYSLLLTSAAVVPLTVLGAVAALLSAWLVPKLAPQYIMCIGATCVVVSCTLVATMPAQQSYWPQAFPAAVLMAFCPDFMFTAAQIVASNSVKRSQQDIAGSLIATLITYGQSTGLGFAGTVEVYASRNTTEPVIGYRNALYLGIGLGALAMTISLLFIRVPIDKQEGWGDGYNRESEGI